MGTPLSYVQDINAPIDVVFDLVEDEDNLKLWMDGLEETIYSTAPDPADPVGTRFTRRIREGGRVTEYECELVAYEKPTHVAVTLGSSRFSMRSDYRLQAIPKGTRVTYSGETLSSSRLVLLIGWLFGWFTRRILKNQMTKLKRVAEERAHSAMVEPDSEAAD